LPDTRRSQWGLEVAPRKCGPGPRRHSLATPDQRAAGKETSTQPTPPATQPLAGSPTRLPAGSLPSGRRDQSAGSEEPAGTSDVICRRHGNAGFTPPQTRKVAPLLAPASRSATTRLSLGICELRLPPMSEAAPTAGIIRTGDGVEVFTTLCQLDHRPQHSECRSLVPVLPIHLVRRRHRRLSSLGFRPHFNTKRVAFLRTQGPIRCPNNSHSECST